MYPGDVPQEQPRWGEVVRGKKTERKEERDRGKKTKRMKRKKKERG